MYAILRAHLRTTRQGKSRQNSPHHPTKNIKVERPPRHSQQFIMDKRAIERELFGSDSEESGREESPEKKREWRTGERRPPPKPGTTVQRSDREQARKAAIFLASPPPPPPRVRGPAATAPRRRITGRDSRPGPSTSATPPPPSPGTATAPPDAIPVCAAVTGTATSGPAQPTVTVQLPTGETVEVPHAAAHIGRRYRARTNTGRWVIRFDHRGRQRSVKRMSDAPT